MPNCCRKRREAHWCFSQNSLSQGKLSAAQSQLWMASRENRCEQNCRRFSVVFHLMRKRQKSAKLSKNFQKVKRLQFWNRELLRAFVIKRIRAALPHSSTFTTCQETSFLEKATVLAQSRRNQQKNSFSSSHLLSDIFSEPLPLCSWKVRPGNHLKSGKCHLFGHKEFLILDVAKNQQNFRIRKNLVRESICHEIRSGCRIQEHTMSFSWWIINKLLSLHVVWRTVGFPWH